MNKALHFLTVAALCGSLVGCASRYADAPAPTRFANEDQQKLQAARHWQLIADHFADQLAGSLSGKLGDRAVHVPQPGGEQHFVEGFRELLVTALVNKGLPVADNPSGALIADVLYNAYRFNPNRVASTYYYGPATALAAGLWAIGGIAAANVSSAAGVDLGAKALVGAAGIEGFAWVANEALGKGKYASGPTPRSEILLTVSVSDGGRIISRQSNIYYTADEDAALYWHRRGSGDTGKTLKIVGDCARGEARCVR
ncbi:MAG: complement resistance protein TraT [Azonexus sp.]|nr:complement resistance protein TraT [Azonexus sp.]